MEKRKELEAIRAQLGDLQTEAKPFDINEPIKIVQVYSSIAGQGSGEYHLYRKQKAREEERQRRMDEEWNEAVAKVEMQKRRLEREAAEEAEREEKRQKRQRKKEAQKLQKLKEKQVQLVGVAEGEFLEVMERKERLKALLLQQAEAEGNAVEKDQSQEQVDDTSAPPTATDTNAKATTSPQTNSEGGVESTDSASEDSDIAARLAAAKARLRAIADTTDAQPTESSDAHTPCTEESATK